MDQAASRCLRLLADFFRASACILVWKRPGADGYSIYRSHPQGAERAASSLSDRVARALLEGHVNLDHFENGAYGDTSVRKLLQRTRASAYTDRSFKSEDPFDADVILTLGDGRTLAAFVEYPLGRTSANPIPVERLEAKFRDCAMRVLTAEAADHACRAIKSIENFSSMSAFTALLELSSIRVVEESAQRVQTARATEST